MNGIIVAPVIASRCRKFFCELCESNGKAYNSGRYEAKIFSFFVLRFESR